MEVTKHQPGMFSWADMATPDIKASRDFYTTFFDLESVDSQMGPGMAYSMLTKNGKNSCAMYEMNDEMKGFLGGRPVWHSHFTVASADEAAKRATDAGGQVFAGPFDIMTSGRLAVIKDPEGAFVSVWEPKDHIGAEVFGEPGALAWTQLYAHDTERAAKFYGALFGWDAATSPGLGGIDYTLFSLEGRNAGGMLAIQKEWGEIPAHWSIYFSVADRDASVEKAKALGAAPSMTDMEVEGVGRMAFIIDPQGCGFTIIEITGGGE